MRVLSRARCGKILGSLSKHDGDSNHNGKRAIGLDKQNNNFARASRFLAHFFAVTTAPQYDGKLPNLHCEGSNFLFLFLNFDAVL